MKTKTVIVKLQDKFTKTKTKDFWNKTNTFFQVLKAPRDQDYVLEDYITVRWKYNGSIFPGN